MKKNNRGFMLVEVIVTSTVIVAALIGLYASFNKLFVRYETRNSYYNVDGVYATKQVLDYLFDTDFNTFIMDTFYRGESKYIVENGVCSCKIESGGACTLDISICPDIVSLYKVKNMILVEYDKKSVYNLTVQNETFKDYLDYVVGYYDIEDGDTKYNYLILTEIENGSLNYYSNLRIR